MRKQMSVPLNDFRIELRAVLSAVLVIANRPGGYNVGHMSGHIVAIATQEGAWDGGSWFVPEP